MILQSNLLLTELSIIYIESRMQNLPFFVGEWALQHINTNKFTLSSCLLSKEIKGLFGNNIQDKMYLCFGWGI